MGNPLRTIFCGTPDFAVPTLTAMLESPYAPVLVVTQPDRPRGRGQRLVPSPVKSVALDAGLPIVQPAKFNTEENLAVLSETKADIAVVVAYSAKVGRKALGLMPHGWLNLHPSFLPEYRGAAPLQWALINGEVETGITTFFLNEEWDAGPICLQKKTSIQPEEDYGRLADRCKVGGARLVMDSLAAIEDGLAPKPQDDDRATFAPLLKPEDSILNWAWTATEIHNRVRGLSPRPGLFAQFNNRRIQILETEVASPSTAEKATSPGMVLHADKNGLQVAAGRGILEILMLRPQNKSSMKGRDFVNGYRVKPGVCFE